MVAVETAADPEALNENVSDNPGRADSRVRQKNQRFQSPFTTYKMKNSPRSTVRGPIGLGLGYRQEGWDQRLPPRLLAVWTLRSLSRGSD